MPKPETKPAVDETKPAAGESKTPAAATKRPDVTPFGVFREKKPVIHKATGKPEKPA